jgi:hypothetical protein
MNSLEIDLEDLKHVTNHILDNLMKHGIKKVSVDRRHILYWDVSGREMFDNLKQPELGYGELSEDLNELKVNGEGKHEMLSSYLGNVAPLFHYLAWFTPFP